MSIFTAQARLSALGYKITTPQLEKNIDYAFKTLSNGTHENDGYRKIIESKLSTLNSGISRDDILNEVANDIKKINLMIDDFVDGRISEEPYRQERDRSNAWWAKGNIKAEIRRKVRKLKDAPSNFYHAIEREFTKCAPRLIEEMAQHREDNREDINIIGYDPISYTFSFG